MTGAASGIGRAVALLAADRGAASIGLVDRDPRGLAEVADAVGRRATRAVPVVADLSTAEGPAEAVAAVLEATGGLDTLVSNAGASGRGTMLDLTVDDWRLVFDLNVRATWLLAAAAYAALVDAQGSVVVTTSVSAHHPTPRTGAYSVSKAAASMLVRQLALEWGPAGVRVNAVAPGPVATPMTWSSFGDPEDPAARERRARRTAATPLRRLGEPEDVAEVVLFLAGPGAVHLTGVEVPVDGGLGTTLMPGSRE
ncbi:SDR family oxidoreductase [Nocardioides panacihumi]|uniref:SDR family oxidoreductase n=1 Tax=Nocardioides panacihumi TaxID=400774 RepID=A0ABN2QDM9_9ACTN